MTRQSVSEAQMIDDREAGRVRLLSEPSSHDLLSALRRRLQTITRNMYIFRWIPEQGEDLYDVLVDGATVVHIEIPRSAQNREAPFEKWPVDEYLKLRKNLTKQESRKLQLALRLARSGRSGSE
jgi:hypothetical protein